MGTTTEFSERAILNRVFDDVNNLLKSSLAVSDIEIGAVELKDGDSDTRADIETDGTKNALFVQSNLLALEAGGNLAAVKTNTDPLVTGAGGGYIRQDSTGTIAKEAGGNLAGAATSLAIVDDWDATQGSAVGADGAMQMEEAKDFDGAAFPNTVTEGQSIRAAASLSGVRFVMPVNEDGSKSPIDQTTGYNLSQEQSPLWARTTDVSQLIVAAQDLTGSPADLGGEFSMVGYRYGRVPITVDINNSTDVRIYVLGKHTSAGAEEYPYDPNKWALRDSTLSSTGAYRELNTDADGFYLIEIEADNCIPYIQIQVCAGTVGAPTAGQIDAAYVLKGY